jgi:hypothetical protein
MHAHAGSDTGAAGSDKGCGKWSYLMTSNVIGKLMCAYKVALHCTKYVLKSLLSPFKLQD